MLKEFKDMVKKIILQVINLLVEITVDLAVQVNIQIICIVKQDLVTMHHQTIEILPFFHKNLYKTKNTFFNYCNIYFLKFYHYKKIYICKIYLIECIIKIIIILFFSYLNNDLYKNILFFFC